MFNPEVVLFNDYLRLLHHAAVASAVPQWAANVGTSLWLRRTPST
jgi:hypothetical protein